MSMSGRASVRISRISRPMRDSPPTMATVVGLSNLVLRPRRCGFMAQTAPYDAARANKNSGGHIRGGNEQQHRLRRNVNEKDQAGDQDDHQRRPRPDKVDVLEARIAPCA